MSLRDEPKSVDPMAYDSLRRDPGPEFSESERAAHLAAFLASGGQIQPIPFGVMSEYRSPSAKADDARRAKGGKKGSAARLGTTNKKPEIRMEDWL